MIRTSVDFLSPNCASVFRFCFGLVLRVWSQSMVFELDLSYMVALVRYGFWVRSIVFYPWFRTCLGFSMTRSWGVSSMVHQGFPRFGLFPILDTLKRCLAKMAS